MAANYKGEIDKMLRTGRRVSGRAHVLALLDTVLSQDYNLLRLAEAMDDAIEANPLDFLIKVVHPMTPMTLREAGDDQASAAEKADLIRQALGEAQELTSPPEEGGQAA